MDDSDPQSGWFADETATFGDRLAAARENAGMSVAELARKTGVRESTVIAWEHDTKEPRANRLTILAGMCGISLSWLMTGQGEGPDAPSEGEGIPSEVNAILTEIRATRVDLAQATDKLARLEKQLREKLNT